MTAREVVERLLHRARHDQGVNAMFDHGTPGSEAVMAAYCTARVVTLEEVLAALKEVK